MGNQSHHKLIYRYTDGIYLLYLIDIIWFLLSHMQFVSSWIFHPHGCWTIYSVYLALQAKLSIIHDLLGKVHAAVVSTEKGQVYRALLNELNAERRQCRSGMRDLFNTSFGATFLTDTGRESSFSYHIHQYADIYTSKLENFLSYAPESWLHPPHDIKIMPHNAKVVWIFLYGIHLACQIIVTIVIVFMFFQQLLWFKC